MRIFELFKNKLGLFVAKRTLAFCVVLSAAAVLFIEGGWTIAAGLFAGGAAGVFKFFSLALVFSGILLKTEKLSRFRTGLSLYLASLVVSLAALAASAKYDMRIFIAMLAGVMLTPFVIALNAFTEALGITRNNFE